MKILVLQMARLGDIFQTWPTFHALQRQGAEVHVLVRPRFAAAAEGCEGISKVHTFATDKILSPVLNHPVGGMRASLDALDGLLSQLDAEKFDRIINLSFSPLSSWITFDLEMRAFARGKPMGTAGYTRHIDGALAIPDDASAFFFAQVGYRAQTGTTELSNRLSIPRLFATIAGVDPIASDWRGPSNPATVKPEWNLPANFVAVHIGASQEAKTLDAAGWSHVVRDLAVDRPVVLLGAVNEVAKARAVQEIVAADESVISLVGQTDVGELFEIVTRAKLLIAGDSALVQIASLVGTAVLNLSSSTVSHWETGPASAGSRVIRYGANTPNLDVVISEARAMLNGTTEGSKADRVVTGPIEEIQTSTGDDRSDFTWAMISAIYLGTAVPKSTEPHLQGVIEQWCEVQSIENYQLESLRDKRGDPHQIAQILERVDQVTGLLVQAEPRLAPIERWWSTERIRLGPQTEESLTDRYLVLNGRLESVLLSLREIEGRHDGQQLDI